MSDYISASELKLRIEKTLADDDTLLAALVTAASRAVDGFCNRLQDGFVALTTAAARVYPGRGMPYVYIDEAPVITLVAVKDALDDLTYVSWATTDWVAFRGDWREPNFNRTPYHGLLVCPDGDYSSFLNGVNRGRAVPTVRVTAKWGYAATVPPVVKEATGVIAARWYKRGQSAWADTLSMGEFGTMEYRKVVDPDVQFMLSVGGYVRTVI